MALARFFVNRMWSLSFVWQRDAAAEIAAASAASVIESENQPAGDLATLHRRIRELEVGDRE